MESKLPVVQFFLRLALGIGFLVPGLDRLGAWGANGSSNNVSWGDWNHFMIYARQTMSFFPVGVVNVLAVIATAAELTFGALLIMGLFTRWAATGSGILTICFALSMMISFGVASPISYSVFTVSAASFLLATIPTYAWSLDEWRAKLKTSPAQNKKIRL